MKQERFKLLFSVGTLIAVGTVAFAFAYRQVERNREDDNNAAAPKVFVSLATAFECGCLQRELDFARPALGLESANASFEDGANISDLREELSSSSSQFGGQINVCGIEEVVRRLNETPSTTQFYATIIDRAGHFYGLHGVIDIEGSRYYQISHGGFELSLLSEEQLTSDVFQESWICQNDQSSGVPVSIGAARLLVDKMWVNLGEAKPLETLQTSFTLTNDSERSIIIGRPETTCGCVVPNQKTSVALSPGESYVMDVAMQSGGDSSFDQQIIMKFWDEEEGRTKEFKLELFGNRRASMIVSSKKIDFGRVYPGDTVTRDFNIKETATDRFDVESLVFEGFDEYEKALSITKNEDETLPGDLRKRSFHLTLKAPNTEGKKKGALRISTTSEQYPVLLVPIEFTVAPIFEVSPNIISFGDVAQGKSTSANFEIVKKREEKVQVVASSLPKEITLKRDGERYQLTFTPEKDGIRNETVELVIRNQNGSVNLTRSIKCTAFVH